jgi:hypothetical protein
MRRLLSAALLAAALSACNQAGQEVSQDPHAAPPVTPELRQAQYLVDPANGKIVQALPPEVLKDVQARLIAEGREDEARNLGRLYDPGTGKVRDEALAGAAQEKIDAMGAAANAGGKR